MFVIGKVTLPRSSRGPSMVGRHAKNRRKLFSGWLCVVIARRGIPGPCAKQIDEIGKPVGTSQWAQQEKVLRPIWIDIIFDNGRGR